jgi:MFS family permease/quinol monooxygenase YgiN
MAQSTTSPWRNGFFLLFITAAFISNTGTWLFNVAAGWLMTDLGGTALSVALVQTANLLPLVLLAIPAGTLGDLGDRRRIILVTQSALIAVNAAFAYLVQAELATAGWLLVFTFLNGVGAAISGPLLTAVIPQMVSRDQLTTAMSIGGISFNAARAIGPMLCGWLITAYSMAFPFWIDAASFAAVVGVIYFWRDDRHTDGKLAPRVFQLAMGDSLRFLRYTPALYNSVIRAILFFLGAGALWALLPLVAKEQLGGDATLYGYLVGAVGVGAVITGLVYDWIADRAGGSNRLTTAMSVLFAGCLVALALSPSRAWAYPAALVAGMSWQLAFTSLISSVQYALPHWFGVRGIAYYFMAMGISLTVGSAIWGWLADVFSLAIAHYVAAGVCAVTALIGRRFPLDQARGADLSAFTKYPEMRLPADDGEDPGGMLLVRNLYEIGSDQAGELHSRLLDLRNKRYRSGALRWHLYRPLEQNGRAMVIESYAEIKHTALERHDERITQEDHDALQQFQDWFDAAGGSCEQEILEEIHQSDD